ncbi:GTP-binding protein [Tulasnella sp. JGI-2019a]|nr:GTP-binding protein [Tulasnella sp. JGI-2019a]
MSEAPSPALEDLQFWGSPNEDVSAFLGSIKRAAIKQGRHLDNEWMISYAESCLRGDAMKWFDEMDPDEPAATEWRSLRKAFLGRFTYPPPPATATALVRKHEMPRAPLPATVSDDFGGFKLKWFKKTLIIGNSGVGKSSFLSRRLGHGWIPSITPTVGIDFQVHNVFGLVGEEYAIAKNAFWDASGAEEYRDLLGLYCQGMTQIWIVYDVTDQKSFEDVRGWHDLVKQNNGTTKKLVRLIGNKCDLYDRRVVQTQHGRDLAAELGITMLYELSARTNEGVQETGGNFLGVMKMCEA